MDVELLGTRVKRVIKCAGISPRILAAVTKIHFTTIYAIIRDSGYIKSYPLTVATLESTLDKIEELVKLGTLPFSTDTPHDSRTKELLSLLTN